MKEKSFNNLVDSIHTKLDSLMRDYHANAICKHHVACCFLSMLEDEYSIIPNNDVVDAIVKAEYEFNPNIKNCKLIKEQSK